MATGAIIAGTGALVSAYQAERAGGEARKQAKKGRKAQRATLAFAQQQYEAQQNLFEKSFANILNLTPEALAKRNIAMIEKGYKGAGTKLEQAFAQKGMTGSGAELEAQTKLARSKAESRSKAKSDAPFQLAAQKAQILPLAPTGEGVRREMGGIADLYGSRAMALERQSASQWGTAGSFAGAALAYGQQTGQEPKPAGTTPYAGGSWMQGTDPATGQPYGSSVQFNPQVR